MGYVITLQSSAIEESAERARMCERALEGKRNYDGLTGAAFHRFYTGYLGEEATHAWMNSMEIPHTFTKVSNGRSQKAEFLCRNDYRVEAKASSDPRRTELVIGTARDLNFTFLIYSRLLERIEPTAYSGSIEVDGWYPRRMVLSFPIGQRYGSPCYIGNVKPIDLAPLVRFLRRK